jgi:hypothetical protein
MKQKQNMFNFAQCELAGVGIVNDKEWQGFA